MMVKLHLSLLMGCLYLACSNDAAHNTTNSMLDATSTPVRPLRIPSIEEQPPSTKTQAGSPLIPSELPLPQFWKSALKALKNNPELVSVMHRTRVSVRGPNTWRNIAIEWSTNLTTADKLRVAREFKLPKHNHPSMETWTKHENRSWRFTKYDSGPNTTALEWKKEPKLVKSSGKRCNRPHHLEIPVSLPKQLKSVFRKMSTKRVIEVQHDVNRDVHEISMTIWYKNGFAQDEHIGQVQTALTALTWRHNGGHSVKQSWTSDDGLSINWYPVREAFSMGCTLKGPLVRFSWSKTR